MPDNKLTDNEIINAYEHCLNNRDCIGCIADEHPNSNKFSCLLNSQDILDLINRLQEEKQNLEIELKAMRGSANSYKAENEELEKTLRQTLTDIREAKVLVANDIKTAKAEAYKEFADEIFELFPADKPNTVISRVTVKHILKGLVGE